MIMMLKCCCRSGAPNESERCLIYYFHHLLRQQQQQFLSRKTGTGLLASELDLTGLDLNGLNRTVVGATIWFDLMVVGRLACVAPRPLLLLLHLVFNSYAQSGCFCCCYQLSRVSC